MWRGVTGIFLCVLAVGVVLGESGSALARPTARRGKARLSHERAVAEVRAIYREIVASASSKGWKTTTRHFGYCRPYEDVERRLTLDPHGIPRVYVRDAGSEDSSLTWRHYYDDRGRLRFVYITGGAVNGSELEHRIYFDAAGRRVLETHDYTKGPGYTFPSVWPRKELVFRPKRAYRARKPTC